jgi:hypothetical protein
MAFPKSQNSAVATARRAGVEDYSDLLLTLMFLGASRAAGPSRASIGAIPARRQPNEGRTAYLALARYLGALVRKVAHRPP